MDTGELRTAQTGEGPTVEEQETGFYDLRFLGKTPDGKQLFVKVTGDKDPGYGSTSKCFPKLPSASPKT